MKVLWVFAHPEPRSLNGSLKDLGVGILSRRGDDVRVSDLYAMDWKATADQADFPMRAPAQRFDYMEASGQAFAAGAQASDVEAEQAKLLWADMVILQFPLWWFSMPAIMKGWIDRTFANGLAYGLKDPAHPHLSLRYGAGGLQGRRSMLVVTASGREAALGPRGVGGYIDDLLFPIQHGILWYAGMQVLPPFVAYNIGHGRVPLGRFEELGGDLEKRLLALESTEPIPFRFQNAGDYDDNLVLRPGLEGDAQGFAMHLRRP